MPDWLIERGVGETRAALIDGGDIVEARILLEGVVPAGTILEARLQRASQPTIAVADGQEYILAKGAPGVTEGASFAIEVTRERIGGAEPWKRPQARLSDAVPAAAPEIRGRELLFPAPTDALEDAGWSGLLEEARRGIVEFTGGELRISVTPAMTLIDVDGTLPPGELTIRGAEASAVAIRRHGIGGSIGIDLPAGRDDKAARQEAAAAIDRALPKPFERTAVNGFGFVQIVRRRTHASLFELAADRPAFEARALLRRAAREKGAIALVAKPPVIGILEHHPAWLDALARQVGGTVGLRADAALPMSGGYAEPA